MATDPDKEAAFLKAADDYLDAVTAAELAIAKAEAKMAAAIRQARHGPGAVTWRAIGDALGVTHQAAMQKWKGKKP